MPSGSRVSHLDRRKDTVLPCDPQHSPQLPLCRRLPISLPPGGFNCAGKGGHLPGFSTLPLSTVSLLQPPWLFSSRFSSSVCFLWGLSLLIYPPPCCLYECVVFLFKIYLYLVFWLCGFFDAALRVCHAHFSSWTGSVAPRHVGC